MNKSDQTCFSCGVEVSAKTLLVDLAAHPQREFPNTTVGHRRLIGWLRRARREIHVCLEATGLYGLDLALALDDAAIPVMVANPRAVRHFAQALMQRSKTDRLDAVVLREYAARMPFDPWRRPSQQALHLLAIARRLRALAEMHAEEKNRLHAAEISRALPAVVRLDVASHLQHLERERERLLRAAGELIQQDPQLARRLALLLSVTGIGELSAVYLLAELHHFGPEATVRQWVAYAGLDPREHSSGSSVAKKPHISRRGNANLRRALYMPAVSAVQHDPHLQGFYQHLLRRGKTPLQALAAVMRKLLHAIFGMFKHDETFQGAKIFTPQPEPEVACA
jgi:transposase